MDSLTVVSRDKYGQVFVEDERGEDGGVVVLVCRSVGASDGGESNGVMLAPASDAAEPDPDEVERKYRGVFPTLETVDVQIPPRPFVLRVDISAFPAGALPFRMGAFIAAAARAAGPSETRVSLDPATAEEWGYAI